MYVLRYLFFNGGGVSILKKRDILLLAPEGINDFFLVRLEKIPPADFDDGPEAHPFCELEQGFEFLCYGG